jgi:hypothetical protein
MPSITSRFTLLAGSAVVVVAASAAVAMGAVDSDGTQPAPAPTPVHLTAQSVAAPKAAPPAARHSRPADAHVHARVGVTAAAADLPAAGGEGSSARAVIRAKAVEEAGHPSVAMAAPPAGVKVEMPTVKPRVRQPSTNLDEHRVSLDGRPQLQLAMSDDVTQEYWDRYNACLHDHGVPLYPNRGLSPVQVHRDPAAEQACAGVMPRMPIAIDIRRNPRFAADLTNEIGCIDGHGVPVTADPAGGFWTYREPTNDRERRMSSLEAEPQRNAIERACELEAFGADDHL